MGCMLACGKVDGLDETKRLVIDPLKDWHHDTAFSNHYFALEHKTEVMQEKQ